jgi:hypothetical protein
MRVPISLSVLIPNSRTELVHGVSLTPDVVRDRRPAVLVLYGGEGRPRREPFGTMTMEQCSRLSPAQDESGGTGGNERSESGHAPNFSRAIEVRHE